VKNIVKAQFIKSAAQADQAPDTGMPEIAIVGRSNAGKSSLVNAWCKRKQLAFVSQKPGHTQLLNFYNIDDHFVLVDLPGYGFARRGQQVKEAWGPAIETYLADREPLAGVILIHDVARDWSGDEENLVQWLAGHGRPILLVLNKIDKLNQKAMAARRKAFALPAQRWPTVFVSATSRAGIEDFHRSVFENLLRP